MKKKLAFIAIMVVIAFTAIWIIHDNVQNKNQNSPLSELSFDELDLNAHPGIGFRVVYESDQFIVFWGAPGLFGYDLLKQDVAFDVDFMKAYGERGLIQGSHSTYVEVSSDWRSITIKYDTPEAVREAYYIDVPTLTYRRGAYEPMESIFGEENAVGYVMPGAKISDTVYIHGDKVWRIFDGYNINESSNPIFNTSEEPPISDLAMSVAVPDFLTDEQKTLYRRAYTLYQAMFGGDTLGIDSFDGASGAYEPYASGRAETTKLDGIEYLLAVNRYRNWESFDSTIHAVFTDSFWAEKNKVTYSDDLVVPIYRESEGRLAMLSFSRGSGTYYNSNFPDEFELKRKTDTSISFSLFGHYSFMYPLEGETEAERDSRVENGFEVTYEFPIRMVQTDAGWRFDEFHSALADEWIAYTVDG